MNTVLHTRYDERITALLLGVLPYDAISGRQITTPVVVVGESVAIIPRPAVPADSQIRALIPMRMPRHPGGRQAWRYRDVVGRVVDRQLPDGLPSMTIGLLVLPAVADRGLVPRRVELTVPPLAWDDGGVAGRTVRLGLFPGATASVAAGLTVVRGRVVEAADGQTSVRWPRAVARDDNGSVVGWAHGDDRGEFVLIIAAAADTNVVAPAVQNLAITVAATGPPVVDPPLRFPDLDLPIEVVEPGGSPASQMADPVASGRQLLPAQTRTDIAVVAAPTGRETFIQLAV